MSRQGCVSALSGSNEQQSHSVWQNTSRYQGTHIAVEITAWLKQKLDTTHDELELTRFVFTQPSGFTSAFYTDMS